MASKQVLFKEKEDTLIVALTPDEGGLDLDTLINALEKVRNNAKHPDRLTCIFENVEGDVSWTIQKVAFDSDWVRLS